MTVIRTFSMDFTSQREHAQREDGQWFTRSQYRDPRYGYKWSAWKPTSAAPANGHPEDRKVRLPK